MKFFLPFATRPDQAEQAYQAIREFVTGQVGSLGPLSEKRIYQIEFSHHGQRFDLRVGDTHPELHEPVIAIFEGEIYFICTPSRGVVRGEPYLVGRHSDTFVELFEPDESKAKPGEAP